MREGVVISGDGMTRARRLPRVRLLTALLLTLAGCTGGFLQPDAIDHDHPARHGLWHDEVRFATANGQRLRGWFLPARGVPLGTVVWFQDGTGNLTRGLHAAKWLPYEGYHVLLFDYRGFGASPGDADLALAARDGAAALRFIRGHKPVDPGKLIVYGRGVGAVLAIRAMAAAGTDGIRLVIVEDGFRSFREVVRLRLDSHVLTWAFQYPVAYGFFSDDEGTDAALPAMAGLPLLALHGEVNETIPPDAGRQLFAAWPHPDKTWWTVPAGGHLSAGNSTRYIWQEQILARLQTLFPEPLPPRGYTLPNDNE